MDHLNNRLEELGRVVSDTSDHLADPTTLAAARRRWLESPQAAPRSANRRRAAFVLAAACVFCAALVSSLIRRPSALSFAVGSPPTQGTVGEWIAASSDRPIVVRFSEGTSLTLAPSAKLRITETTSHGAGVLLEQGSVEASVVHTGAGTKWALRAGPFDVRVTGTRFEAAWDPVGETFEITMREGSVVVRGPVLSSERALVAGEHLRISMRDGVLALHTSQPNAPTHGAAPAGSVALARPRDAVVVAPPVIPSAITTLAPPVAPSAAASAVATTAPRSSATPAAGVDATAPAPDREPSWRELASAGKYKAAFEATERVGFLQEIERGSSADLATLTDIARFAGRPALAREALLAQRRRFGARGQSAFLIGKTAADQQGNSAEGVRWFEVYLSEEPGGALAEQALGRIMELTKKDSAAARSAAERSIARYPSGSYAGLARSILAR
ncbi:MAG: FecR domain-containing protein [Byssovorax sp.]